MGDQVRKRNALVIGCSLLGVEKDEAMRSKFLMVLAVLFAAPVAQAEDLCQVPQDQIDAIRARLCQAEDRAPGCAERTAITRLAPIARNIQILKLCGDQQAAAEARMVYLKPGETYETLLPCLGETFSYAETLAALERETKAKFDRDGTRRCDPAHAGLARSFKEKLAADGLSLTFPGAGEQIYYQLGVTVTDKGAIIERPEGWQRKPNKGSATKGTQEQRPQP